MVNALNTLFQDIANAIRDKTGGTETMKPAEFPNKIAEIEGTGNATGLFMKFYGMTTSNLKFTIVDTVTTVGDGKTFNSLVVSSIPANVMQICAIIDDGYEYTIGCVYDAIAGGWVYDYRIHADETLSVPYTGNLTSYTAPDCLTFISDNGSCLEFRGSKGNGTLAINTTAANTTYKIIVG